MTKNEFIFTLQDICESGLIVSHVVAYALYAKLLIDLQTLTHLKNPDDLPVFLVTTFILSASIICSVVPFYDLIEDYRSRGVFRDSCPDQEIY